MQERWAVPCLLGGIGLLVVVFYGMVGSDRVQAQQIQACVPIKTLVNTAGQLMDIQVPSTPVIVLSVNAAACQRLISNVGTAPMRCLPSNQGPPNPTQGLLIPSGSQFLMGTEGRDEWKCVATTATPTVATTIEGLP